MDRLQLRRFLVSSALQGYASGKKDVEIKEKDGSTSVIVEEGPWRSHDNWDGGEPYGGRIRVSYEGKAVWTMVYYGKVIEGVANLVDTYGLLIRALQQMPSEAPYRGPREYSDGAGPWRYDNGWCGAVDAFHGEEHIYCGNTLVYVGWYRGGLVNVTEED
jgi:hypothetical protein